MNKWIEDWSDLDIGYIPAKSITEAVEESKSNDKGVE